MTETYSQLVKQIESLKLQAERVRREDVNDVIKRIRGAITAYDLTAEDLGFAGTGSSKPQRYAADKVPAAAAKRRRRGTGVAAAKAQRTAKFSNGNGGTWGGVGKRPQWLRDALNQGKSLEDFRVR